MTMEPSHMHTLEQFTTASGRSGRFWSLPALALSFPGVRRMPVSLRIVLESVLRHCDGQRVTLDHVEQLARWQPLAERTAEIPFVVARVVLQDFTGVPLLADLAAMRNEAQRLGRDPTLIEPLVPVDLVVDHSVIIDHFGSPRALDLNMRLEFSRNRERYQFLKWGMQAFKNFGVVPPGFDIVHQVDLEHLARGVHRAGEGADAVYHPDSLVGTDSHTTMINGIGVVGWGVGGIEAEAAMLGQPVYLLTPDVVGVELTGALREGVTATDLVLTITETLRREKVVGQFVEFCGEGTRTLSVPDRATVANMAPEYGATMGFFPVDETTLDYFNGTGRTAEETEWLEAYFKAQQLFGVPRATDLDYSRVIGIDLSTVALSLAGPKRPQDRIEVGQVKQTFTHLYRAPAAANGFNQPAGRLATPVKTTEGLALKNGDVLIAAITSCTNTSNPGVMLAAGLLAKKAVEAGLRVAPHIKTSLAPGSRMVTEYLERAGLLSALEMLGFAVAAYGCTTCIGNAGDLDPALNAAIQANDLVCAAVLSGNRNFEARIHPNLKARFLASPPLVVAYALAGTVLNDLMTEPIGHNATGRPVFLGDIWPGSEEVHALMKHAGTFEASSPAGRWLQAQGVARADFNSYGARRGHQQVMMRGTFANVRVKNLMLPANADGSRVEGGFTLKDGRQLPVYEAAMLWQAEGTPTVVFAGEEYGTGSSRDWAAKGTALLGIRAVVARSFERIHRSNRVGMGVLPLQLKGGDSWQSLGLAGDETIDVCLPDDLQPRSDATLLIVRADGTKREVQVTLRGDAAIEVAYLRHGGILPFVLRQLLSEGGHPA